MYLCRTRVLPAILSVRLCRDMNQIRSKHNSRLRFFDFELEHKLAMSGPSIPPKVKLTKAEKKAKYRNDYAEPIKSRREALKAIMNPVNAENNPKGRELAARSLMREYFDQDYKAGSRVNMYGRAVEMMKAMPDRGKTGGQCLAEWYLVEFGEWLRSRYNRGEQLRDSLTPTIQMEALRVCNVSQKTLLCEVFNITQEKLIDDITTLLDAAVKKQDYVNAAEMAIQYNLVHKYTFEELALPLLLSGREKTAFKMLEGHVDMQVELVKFLDSMSGVSVTTVEDMLQPYRDRNIMTISTDRFTGKTLDKLIQTVINKNVAEFNFDKNLAQYAKNHLSNSNMKHLKYIITERYSNLRSDENYFQHVVQHFTATPEVREPTLHFLWDSNQYEKQVDAISIAVNFMIDYSSCPHLPGKMKDFFRAPDSRLKEARELLERRKSMRVTEITEEMYVYEEEKQHRIFMVINESGMNNLCSHLMMDGHTDPVYVGFDSEWKPSNLTGNSSSKIAIIQLFFNDNVWLVDCVALEKANASEDCWQKFADRLFLNKKLRIIGFDMRNDLDAMATIPALRDFLKVEKIENCFDLKRLAENVCEIDMDILELAKKTFKLADLTFHLLGKALDKTEQCSNWESRPLRKNQIIYAALDAVVVVETYKKILEVTLEKNETIDCQKLEKDSNVLAPKKEKNNKTFRKLKTIQWNEIYETLRHHRDSSKPLQRPHEIQVIVDTMLLGFGKHLRRCGIDVILPRDVNDFRSKLKLISRLGGDFKRHIITVPSKSYEALKKDYGRSIIALADLNDKSPLDQLIDFFDLFNIDIRPEDEYLRCIECNSRLQIKFPGPVLHFLHQYCIIHLQNVYRADMSEFPIEEWWHRMNQINPADYDGIEVKMSRPRPQSKWIVATVPTGCLHITRQTAIHNNLPEGVEVRISKVPDDEFQRPNLCFYVCGDCGTVAYDGRASSSASNSRESVH